MTYWSLALVCLILCSVTTIQAATLAGFHNGNINIPDYPGNQASLSVVLSGAAAGSSITSIDIYYEIRHPYSGDLKVWLTAFYDGAWHDFTLRNRTGAGVDDIVESRNGLTSWNGVNPNQTWYLVAQDFATGDAGYIDYFQIAVNYSAPGQPDLIKSTDNLSNLNPYPGNTVTASVTIQNSTSCGSATAGAFHVGYYWSTSPTFSGVSPFYQPAIGSIAGGGTAAIAPNITIDPTTTPGTYYLGYKIDVQGEVAECNENNNGIFYWTVNVQPPASPEIDVRGNSVSIVDGDTTPSTGDYTDFGSTPVGTTVTRTYYIYNTGTAALTVGTITVPSGYTVIRTPASPIAVGGSDYLNVRLNATAAATYAGDISIVNNDSNENPYNFRITGTVNTPNAPNLTPFQPSGWSDKVVVSRATGNNTDSTGLTIGDVLYVDWAVLNNGSAAAGSLFYTELYLDGVLKQTWSTPAPLNATYYANVFDYNLGSLSAGTHTLRIRTDSTGVIAESNESVSDNEYTKTFSVGSTSLPDFIITSISLSPSVPQPGQTYTAYVTVKNQGAVSGDGKWLDVWANQSASQACGADGNTWTSVGVLTANQSKTFTFSMTAPATAGSYPFRAFVDSACQTTESNDGNNQTTLAYSVVAPGQLPDFVVTGISLNPASPAAGQSFTANVTVKNQGAAAGNGGWLDVWANKSSAVSCGTDGNNWASIGTLTAGQSKTYYVTLTAPASGGSYTLRAFADSYCQTTESNDSNNQTTFDYTVGAAASPPDFLVTSVTFNPATPVGGQPFTAYVTVKNEGAGLGNAGWLSVWVNQPSAQSCGANGDQNQSVGTLAAGQSVTKTFNLTTPASGAPWTFRAFADSGCQTAETSDANNQTTVSYGANPVQSPDFLITGITISPTAVKAGAPFTAYITVKNQGVGSGDAGWLDVWANAPMTASCGANGNAYQKVGTLAAGASKVLTVSLTAGPAGVNTLLAFVDSTCGTVEPNEANNQTAITYDTSYQAVLLLHGMNSDPTTWDDFVDFRGVASVKEIFNGVIRASSSTFEDTAGVGYYAVVFGSKDTTSGYLGLNDQGGETLSANGASNGDFSSFDQLGQEVQSAVAAILARHGSSTRVALVGHSREGVAARAHLQNIFAPTETRSAVVSLLTLGTPHSGSRLGRIYDYLKTNPKNSSQVAAHDWNAAVQLREPFPVGTFDLGLDLRRPVIKFLADNSDMMASLNFNIGLMPVDINYGVVSFESVSLGYLRADLNYDALDQTRPDQSYQLIPFSQTAEDFLLANSPIADFAGDGIVHISSQLSGFQGRPFTSLTRSGVVHVDETKTTQTSGIFSVLKSVTSWWDN